MLTSVLTVCVSFLATPAETPGREGSGREFLEKSSASREPSDGAPGLLDREAFDYFERRIRPVLANRCYRCHSDSAEKLRGGLRADHRAGLLAGGKSGEPAVVPGKPEASKLLRALRGDGLRMPPDGPLEESVIRDFERWVKAGAADPRAESSGVPIRGALSFWSFEAPRARTPPGGSRSSWPRQQLDHWILARLEEASLEPSPEAHRQVLIRRLFLNLTGLPPTPDSMRAALEDPSPDAYERLVDRLLASPRFGEHWARMWLDVARYAEDQAHIVGNNKSLFYPNAYLYRDWVIRAFNDDLPFEAFVEYQLAADVVDPDGPHIAALGFLGLGPKYYDRGRLEVKAEEWEDRVDVVTRGFLGMTVACARCHDHKYDPVSTEDYYALAGVFASTQMFNRPLQNKTEQKKGQSKNPGEAMHVVREHKPTDLNVFVRGDVQNKGPLVPRRSLPILHVGSSAPELREGSGRAQLAGIIASPNNPLSARVFVNRVWTRLFGRGLVGTPSNFGTLGERPTHPELLDNLAVRFGRSGGSTKTLVHALVTSATFRQGNGRGGDVERDPGNRLYSRMTRRRLAVEIWRDSLLSAAGDLSDTIGGPSMDPTESRSRRRTVYSEVSRFRLHPMLALFDFPDPNVHAGSRSETITSLQKLFVLNNPFMLAVAERLVARVERELAVRVGESDVEAAKASTIDRIEVFYSILFQRPPSRDEFRLGVEFIGGDAGETSEGVWLEYAQVLLAANELFYVD